MIFTAAGLAFSILAAQSCELFTFSGAFGQNSGAAGLFSYTDPNGGGCVEYPAEAPIEPTDNTARVCGALAAIFGLVALVMIIFEFCICKLWCARCLAAGLVARVLTIGRSVARPSFWNATTVRQAAVLFWRARRLVQAHLAVTVPGAVQAHTVR